MVFNSAFKGLKLTTAGYRTRSRAHTHTHTHTHTYVRAHTHTHTYIYIYNLFVLLWNKIFPTVFSTISDQVFGLFRKLVNSTVWTSNAVLHQIELERYYEVIMKLKWKQHVDFRALS